MFRLVVFLVFLTFTFAENPSIYGKTKNGAVKPKLPLGTSCSPSEYDYVLFKGFCYALIKTIAPADFGEKTCRMDGGNLVSIHNIVENEFVRNLGLPPAGAWIGLKKEPHEFLWYWTDGTDSDYNHWTDTPTYEDKPLEFAKMEQSGFWNYEEPGTKMFFVCKKPAE